MNQLTLDSFADLPGARRYDGYITILCPFHSDHRPSLLVFPDGKFKCLACGEWGHWDKLWKKIEGEQTAFVYHSSSAVTPRFGSASVEDVAMEAHRQLVSYPGFDAYLKTRKVDSMINRCRLGWYEGWYTVPAWDEEGNFAGMGMRASAAVQEYSGLRFFIPPAQSPILYVPLRWSHLRKAEKVYVTFGLFDALVMAAAGYAVVTVIGGHKAMHPSLLDSIRKPIIVVPEPGEIAPAQQLTVSLGWRGHLHLVDWPENCKDPNDLVMKGYDLRKYIP